MIQSHLVQCDYYIHFNYLHTPLYMFFEALVAGAQSDYMSPRQEPAHWYEQS